VGGSYNQHRAQAPWPPGVNPWTGMVQAWQMPFRAPGTGVLGPRPGTSSHQAYYASTSPPPNMLTPPQSPSDVWNQQALLAALASANNSQSGPQTAEWFLDTGASSHMSSNSGNFISSQPITNSAPITLGNGSTMPVTHRAHTLIPIARSPLHLNNILISPSLVKNLISVRTLTRDKSVLNLTLLVFLLRIFQHILCSSDVIAKASSTLWPRQRRKLSSQLHPPLSCGTNILVTLDAVLFSVPCII
jgi:hypothetical protein